MPDASSPGNAQPNPKTINVEANLLAEWLTKKGHQREEVLRYLLSIGAVLLVAGAVIPVLVGMRMAAGAKAQKTHSRMMQLASTLSRFQIEKDAASPRLAHQEIRLTTKHQSDDFMAQLVYLMNSSSSQMALNSVQGDVLGGEMTLRCKADSKDFGATREFVTAAAGGAHVLSAVLVSSRSSNAIGPAGISFEFVKRVEVGQ